MPKGARNPWYELKPQKLVSHWPKKAKEELFYRLVREMYNGLLVVIRQSNKTSFPLQPLLLAIRIWLSEIETPHPIEEIIGAHMPALVNVITSLNTSITHMIYRYC